MRKVRAVLFPVLLAAGLSLTLGAAPANAERLTGIYRTSAECQRVGAYGESQGWWDEWRCEWKAAYSYYFLYS
ncbi:hypothetical protein AB0K40_28125 [Nonomuraea bangladeshensis]|uniref:Uncharacterized protein n=1 Tax=Nonomuraea bangladeshensis TaxID=404385 RepID=A0ABV3HA52_9ACTN